MDFIRNNYAFFLSVLDRQDEALAELEEQRSRDPLNQRMHFLQKGIVLIQARRFDEALQAYSDAQAVEPSKEIFPFTLGYAYAGKGHYNEAITYYKKAVVDHGGEEKYSQPLVYLAATYAKLPEKRAEARVILARIERMPEYVSPALLAAIYAELGENDKAMELLERAFIKRDLLLRFIKTGYEYDSLRNDARFVDLTKRIGLLH
jgi:tetratricopeptide (TPR) repeat protein